MLFRSFINGIRSAHAKIRVGKHWHLIDRKYAVERVIGKIEIAAENWISGKEKIYPDLFQTFEKYGRLRDENVKGFGDKLHEKIDLILYNRRYIIKK